MSQFSAEPQRPAMRRKSSAQNLLSSFKVPPNPGSTPQPTPQPLSVSSTAAAAYTGSAGAPTPTVASTTPVIREWDAQSLHSDSVGTQTPALGQGTSDEYLRDLIQKRILTLTYIRNIHEGKSHWFHTIYISRADLDREFNNNDMKKRTTRFAILGMSLGNLMDMNQPQDLLRALLNILLEYDQAKEDNEKPKMRPPKRLFRTKLGGKRPGVLTEFSGTYVDASADTTFLVNPQIPFSLDYHQTLLSLLDVLSEVYNKIAKLIGPSPLPQSSQHMMGPLGLLSPHPGVSYLFSDGPASAHPSNHQFSPNFSQQPPMLTVPSEPELSSSLWEIANAGGGPAGTAGGFVFGGGGAIQASSWSPSFGELVLKIDSKFKKITSTLLKELDQFARSGIKEELASLDPLLRNIKMPDLDGFGPGGKGFDYEAN